MDKHSTDLLSLAKRELAKGNAFRAYDLASAISDISADVTSRKTVLQALALARSGATRSAIQLAGRFTDGEDPEVMGLKARLWKDLAKKSSDPSSRKLFFLRSAQISRDAFARNKSWYNGVNAVSCLFMAGKKAEAEAMAGKEVLPLCLREENRDIWLVATLGECHLILGHYDEAVKYYAEAIAEAAAGHLFGHMSSMLGQLEMLAGEIGAPCAGILQALDIPSVILFTGHMIDAPGRIPPRFPAGAEPQVRADVARAIIAANGAVGFSSCACGGDVIFLEEMLRRGAECNIVLPFPLETTIRNSVSNREGNWEVRLRKVLESPLCNVIPPECGETDEDDDLVYDFTNRYALGLALLKSGELHFPLRGICVWNGEPGLVGGASTAIELWKGAGVPFARVAPEV